VTDLLNDTEAEQAIRDTDCDTNLDIDHVFFRPRRPGGLELVSSERHQCSGGMDVRPSDHPYLVVEAESVPEQYAPAGCTPSRDRVDVFVRDGLDTCSYRSMNAPPHGPGWSEWESLGGQLTSDVSAWTDTRGSAYVMHRGNDGRFYWLHTPGPGKAGSTWQPLDGIGSGTPAACAPAADRDRIDVFARGDDGACWYRSRDPAGGSEDWSAWESLGGVMASELSAWGDGQGTAYATHRGTDGAFYWLWKRTPGVKDSVWQPMPDSPIR
jgi:hypothetical protein